MDFEDWWKKQDFIPHVHKQKYVARMAWMAGYNQAYDEVEVSRYRTAPIGGIVRPKEE